VCVCVRVRECEFVQMCVCMYVCVKSLLKMSAGRLYVEKTLNNLIQVVVIVCGCFFCVSECVCMCLCVCANVCVHVCTMRLF